MKEDNFGMKKEKIKITIFLKVLLLLFGVMGVIGIAFYPYPRQDLMVVANTDVGEVSYTFTAGEIKKAYLDGDNSEKKLEIKWENLDVTTLNEIDIYRVFKSIIIEKYNDSETEYYYSDHSGVYFTYRGVEILYKLSSSLLTERLIWIEALGTVIFFLWILVNALNEKIHAEKRDNHGPIYEISNFIKNIKKYRKYMVYAAKADLKAEVANSYLNRLWWILEPFCNMMVYVVIFGHVMGNNIENYATFVFSALIMWNYFSHIINYSVKCIRYNRDIVTKIYVPKYILLLTNMILNFIKLLFSVVVLIIMLCIFRVHIDFSILWIIPAYLLMLFFTFGIGMIFLHYGVFIDDLGYAVGILLNMLMFLSGIFYDVITGLSSPLNYFLLCGNPVIIFIEAMRNALLFQRVSNVPLVCIWIILSLLIGYIGIHIVNKNENGYVKVI